MIQPISLYENIQDSHADHGLKRFSCYFPPAEFRSNAPVKNMRRCLAHQIDGYKRGLVHALRVLRARSPLRELMMRRNYLADLHRRLIGSPARLLENAKHRFSRIEGILRVLGPDATLRRGYSITTNDRGEIIRTTAVVRPKMKIRTRVSDGEFGSEVTQ